MKVQTPHLTGKQTIHLLKPLVLDSRASNGPGIMEVSTIWGTTHNKCCFGGNFFASKSVRINKTKLKFHFEIAFLMTAIHMTIQCSVSQRDVKMSFGHHVLSVIYM